MCICSANIWRKFINVNFACQDPNDFLGMLIIITTSVISTHGGVSLHWASSSPNEFSWGCKFVDSVFMVKVKFASETRWRLRIIDEESSSNFWHKVSHSLINIAFTRENKMSQKLIWGARQVSWNTYQASVSVIGRSCIIWLICDLWRGAICILKRDQHNIPLHIYAANMIKDASI